MATGFGFFVLVCFCGYIVLRLTRNFNVRLTSTMRQYTLKRSYSAVAMSELGFHFPNSIQYTALF